MQLQLKYGGIISHESLRFERIQTVNEYPFGIFTASESFLTHLDHFAIAIENNPEYEFVVIILDTAYNNSNMPVIIRRIFERGYELLLYQGLPLKIKHISDVENEIMRAITDYYQNKT